MKLFRPLALMWTNTPIFGVLMPQHPDKPVVETPTEARSGETGHNVRYVLGFGLGGIILAFAALLWYFAG